MKVKTWFKRVNNVLLMFEDGRYARISQPQAEKTREELHQLFELFRPYLEDDMIVAIKDLERT